MSQTNGMKIWIVGIAVLFLAGSGSAIIPADGLALHVNAQNVTQSGGQVTELLDQSGNGLNIAHNATSSSTYGGTLNSGVLNSYDTLTIANHGFRMTIADSANVNAGTNGLTLFLVASLAHTADVDVLRKHTGATSSNPGYYLKAYKPGSGRNFSLWATTDSSNRREVQYADAAPGFFVMAIVVDPSADKLSTFYNGAGFTATTTTGGLNDLSNSANFDIGRTAAGQMDFAELLIYNRVLTTDEWNEVGATLGTKYGIGTTYVIPEPIILGNADHRNDGVDWNAAHNGAVGQVHITRIPGKGSLFRAYF